MQSAPPDREGQSGEFRAALRGSCPECGSKTLFGVLTDFAPSCSSCGLDFSKFNVGDGPAAFLTLIIGALMIVLVLWSEFAFHPPVWFHFVFWPPVLIGAVIWGLRFGKAWLLQAEYWRRAKEATGGDVGEAEE
jgi:uncharacterized protein (DUF983 family)